MSYYEEERDNKIISALKEISSQLVNIKKAIETKEDVVPVVRCKDCKHFVCQNTTEPYCQIWTDKVGKYRDYDCDTEDDNYCGYGERKKQ